jgi:hypothetical protein
MTDSKVRLAILSILKEALPYALPEATLLRHLNSELQKPVKQLALDDHLLFLKKQACVVAVPGQLGDVQPRWKITASGLGEIA